MGENDIIKLMGKIISYITMANGNLSDKKDMILNAIRIAEDYAFPKLKIDWDIDVVVTNQAEDFVIPEDGVGGRTYTSEFILLAVDDEKITENFLSEMLVHELCHAARWGKNDEWMHTFADGAINEGIATYFESEFVKNRNDKQFFIKTITNRSEEENQKIFEMFKNDLDNIIYDYPTIFFDGNKEIPRWSGYSLGYYLVKKYLEETKKTIDEAFADKYEDFKKSYLDGDKI